MPSLWPGRAAASPPDLMSAPLGRLRSELGAVLAAGAVLAGARIGEHLPWASKTLPACALIAGLALAAAVSAAAARRAGSAGTRSLFWRASPRRWRVEARQLPAEPQRPAGIPAGSPPPADRRRRVLPLLCLTVLGAVSMARALAGLDGVPARMAAIGAAGQVTVRLAGDPRGRWTSVRVPARLEYAGGAAGPRAGPVRGTVLVVAKRAGAERLRLLEAGESAVLVGWFRPLSAGERGWRWRHAGAVFEAGDLVGAGRAAPPLLRMANGVRHRVLAGGAGLDDTDRALVAGFLVGDDRGLPPRVSADFRAAGLSHLLVVSGANVTLALALFGPVLRRFGLVGRLVGGLAVLIVFCAMTRFEPSVLRAGAMAGVALLAAFLGRPVAGLRVLALVVGALVLVDPFLLHSLGFGLSCAASAGILLLAGPLARRLPGPRAVREPLAITTAAQIGVAPVALPAFGHLPLAALPANLAAAPAAAALSLWGLGSGLAGGLLEGAAGSSASGPAAWLQLPTVVLAGWIRLVARLAARWPVTIGPRSAVLVGVITLAWSAARRVRRRPAAPAVSGAGADAVAATSRRLVGRVGLQSEQVVDSEEAGSGDQQRRGRDGVEEVQLESRPAALADRPDAPGDLGNDPQHLQGDEGGPPPGEQAQHQAEPADELDDDGGSGQETGEREPVPGNASHELADTGVELAVAVQGEESADDHADGQQRGGGREGAAEER
jgi:ComEC/Rec2-related protein